MKKIIINLKRREDRKKKFEQRNAFLKDVHFLDGFDAKDLTHDKLLKRGMDTNRLWRDPYHNRKITRGEIGCFISHATAWQHCIQINEPIMVFEDDAIVNEELWNEDYLTQLTTQYNFVYLGHNENEEQSTQTISDDLVVPGYAYNLHAYIITPDAAKLLLSTPVLTNIIPVDDYVAIMKPHLRMIALRTDYANQSSRDETGTDIEPLSEDDWFVDFTVHPVTVGTDRKKCVQLMDSAMLKGIHPKNLGRNVDWFQDMSGPGGGMKLNLMREYLNTLPDHDVVLFVDAYDVFFADDLKTITQRYLGFKTNVLFSAERYCWPDESLAPEFPESETPYRYLNSGTYIGRVDELKKIFAAEIDARGDDQYYCHKQFLSGKFDMKMDYEGYIFQTHEPLVSRNGTQLYNPVTGTYGCIYHGNGGEEAKRKFDALYRMFYPKFPTLYIPNHGKFDIISNDMLVVDFMTQSQCEDLINIADKHGNWGSLNYDKFPAQEIRMKSLGLWEELEKHWQKHLYPIIEEYWAPIEMYGMRDAFVMRYAMDTQTSLANHHDASLVTGSVKLNDDYEGAELVFGRQSVSNKDIAVGRAVLFPGQVTHGHECVPLRSGVKYSLTMWSSRYPGDIGG